VSPAALSLLAVHPAALMSLAVNLSAWSALVVNPAALSLLAVQPAALSSRVASGLPCHVLGSLGWPNVQWINEGCGRDRGGLHTCGGSVGLHGGSVTVENACRSWI
jgi:hypothetical protein